MKLTLCGSAKFEKDYHIWNKLLSLAGHVVYGLAAWPSIEGKKDWFTEEEKNTLDLIHLAKIDASDAIVVLNPGGYVGESTKKEILWAYMNDKSIFALTDLRVSFEYGNALQLLPPDLLSRTGTQQ